VLVVTPTVGSRIRLVATHGVAAPALRAQAGKVGTVLATRPAEGGLEVHARFPAPDGPDDFWLKPGEWAPVATETATEETTVADFATAVQARIDLLAHQDAALAEQAALVVRQREANARERRALAAAADAYNRARNGQPPARKRRSPGLALLHDWALAHGGRIVLAEMAPAAAQAGVSVDALRWAAAHAAGLERVGKGVYRVRAGAAEAAS
jgi:hypothetical protein